ncbi:M42 family peptidase [Ruminococcaceae bacterium AM07-15]|nr:M42 family peptidase [Ruminococcaceae bacterium AM07-15]
MIDILKTFTHLQSVARPSGFESPCAQAIAELAGPYCDEVKIDTLGNVICHKKGPGKRLMMAAHMDVIGLIITHIDKKGFLRFGALGGFVPYRLIGARMKLENGMGGSVWCDEKAMEEKKLEDITLNDLYLDIGAESEESARKMVQVGDVAMYEGEPQQLGQMLLSPYCDDLIACAALLSAMSQVEKSENDLYFVFTVQEEVGLRGAATAAYAIDPDFGVCMDVTRTGDNPSEKAKMVVKLGAGPTIKIKDVSLLCNPQVIAHLREAAKEGDVPYQDEVLTAGGTDSAAIQKTRGGVLSGCISIPCRYIHSQNEMVSLKDVEQSARLMALCAQRTL